MADRLFRYLLREPEAREKAFATLQRVQWEARELDGPMRYVYPEFVKQRREALGLPELATPVQHENRQLGSSLEPKWNLPPSAGTGEGQFGEALQFDTRGVEFGPWVRRFLAQVRRNWFIPSAAMSLMGHVAVSFNVHKDGTITDIVVVGPSRVDAFNTSSLSAIAASSPVQPLPAEYPEEKALITITFYYNETPPQK
jgi:TonB family protein